MKEDKASNIRHIMTVITLLLIFMTICLCLVGLQVKVISFNYYGKEYTVKTLATNVRSFLLTNNIYIDKNAVVYPSLESQITNKMRIELDSNVETAKINIDTMLAEYTPTVIKIMEQEEILPFVEETIENPSMYRGVSKIQVEGKEGTKKVRYIVKYVGEEEVEKTIVDEEIIQTATNRVVEVGTNINLAVSRSNGIVIPSVDEGFKIYNIPLSADMQQYTYAMCQKYGIQYELLLGVMYIESRYNVNAVGGGNSYGLCQIHYSNYYNLNRRIGLTDLLDPYDNIEAGAYMLSMYMDLGRKRSSEQYFIEHYGLNCYNMGEGVYVSNCYNYGILERTYSRNVIAARDSLINSGGI